MKWLNILLICFCSLALAEGRSISFDGIILERIQRMWSPTSDVPKNAFAEVEVGYERNGKIKHARITRSSGDNVFNSSVIMAIMNAGMIPEMQNMDIETYKNHYSIRRLIIKPEDLERLD